MEEDGFENKSIFIKSPSLLIDTGSNGRIEDKAWEKNEAIRRDNE